MVIGIIPDGNRRWAKEHGLTAHEGHEAGLDRLDRIIEELIDEVDHLYIYLLAWHNLERDVIELMNLMRVEAPVIQKWNHEPNITFQFGHPPRKIGPPIDIVIRSMPGNSELSGFFPEESKNAKVIVLNKYWPDVTVEDIHEAIKG